MKTRKDFMRYRNRWAHAQLGYSLPPMTAGEWDRFDKSSDGRLHGQNLEALYDEFDIAVWPTILALTSNLKTKQGPFEVPRHAVERHESGTEGHAARRASGAEGDVPQNDSETPSLGVSSTSGGSL